MDSYSRKYTGHRASRGAPWSKEWAERDGCWSILSDFLGGNIAWILTHPDSSIPTVGASGAVFEFSGPTACWPSDKVEFPVFIFIRPWPIWVIVLVYLGFELWVMMISNI